MKIVNVMNFVRYIDDRYQKLFKEKATEKTELGLWCEIVEPLAPHTAFPTTARTAGNGTGTSCFQHTIYYNVSAI